MKQTDKELNYNHCVRLAYFQILKEAKQMIATIERDELRYTLERIDNVQPLKQGIVRELVNPLIYLRLELHSDNEMAIHFGIECVNEQGLLSLLTSQFLRLLYKVTTVGAYPVNIESCIRTDWFINSCSEMYSYIEDRNKYHTFRKIKYKVTAQKRKQILSVA